jgi:hypothetical protein
MTDEVQTILYIFLATWIILGGINMGIILSAAVDNAGRK